MKKKIGISGIKDLHRLQQRVEQRHQYITSLNGSKINLAAVDLAPGPVLHQDGETMSEEESAIFEKNNPKVVAFLQSLKHKLDDILREP